MIYMMEETGYWSDLIRQRMTELPKPTLCVSDLVRLECNSNPRLATEPGLKPEYAEFNSQFTLLPLYADAYDLAAELRLRRKLKIPDALHLSCAILGGCEEFWTNDKRLAEMTDRIRIYVPTPVNTY